MADDETSKAEQPTTDDVRFYLVEFPLAGKVQMLQAISPDTFRAGQTVEQQINYLKKQILDYGFTVPLPAYYVARAELQSARLTVGGPLTFTELPLAASAAFALGLAFPKE